MKKEGNKGYNYSLQLVAADGLNAPFPEHISPDGTTHAEVEPDAEYFVKVDVRDVGGDVPRLLADLYVDEQRQRKSYCVWKKKNSEPILLGFRSYFDGVKTVTAFKFNKVGSILGSNVAVGGTGTAPPSIGKIRVEFYESQYRGPRYDRDYKADSAQTWSGRDVDASGIGKKVLKSTSGDTVKSIKESRPSHYKKGKFVESIEIKYCTAQGLIHAGIWPKVSAIASASASQDQAEVIDLTDADDLPVKKKVKTESGPVDLTEE